MEVNQNKNQNKKKIINYDPLKDPVYMSNQMLDYFYSILTKMKNDLIKKEESISLSLVNSPNKESDFVDQGINEELRFQVFMFQEHEDSLRKEAEKAIKRIQDGTFGYCEETGDPIGLKRLLVEPSARYCLEVQKEKENKKK